MSKKILVVDDSETAAEVLKTLLEFHGYEATVGSTATRAKDILLILRFDAIILDYCLDPFVNGLQMLRWIRDNGIPTPVMVHSAVEAEVLDEVREAVAKEQLGPVSVVAKPRKPELLVQDIEALVGCKVGAIAYEVRP